MTKICTKCKTKYSEPLEKWFGSKVRSIDGFKTACKKCTAIYQKQYNKQYRKTDKGKAVIKRANERYQDSGQGVVSKQIYGESEEGQKVLQHNARKAHLAIYGLTIKDYNAMFQMQNGCCAICGINQSKLNYKLNIDHNHSTKQVRGLLCGSCNKKLAGFDDIKFKAAAEKYLNDDGVVLDKTIKIDNVIFGKNVSLNSFINLYGCSIGTNTTIGPFVEIGGASIGSNCKICSHSYICPGIIIGDNIFIGHGVFFCNDKYPRATNKDGQLQTVDDWEQLETKVGNGASIGSGAIILPGIIIGGNSMVGAGCVVTGDVPSNVIVAGNPARVVGGVDDDS